jgi:hypothetical protein
MELTFRKFRVLWLRLYCLNLNSDLVQSIAHRKATDTGVAVCSLLLILGGQLFTAKECTVSAFKGMSEEPKGC